MEDLLGTFPDDPTTASLTLMASSGTQITLPWSKKPIRLGAGFQSSAAKNGDPFDVPCSAFRPADLLRCGVQYQNDDGLRGSSYKTSSSNSCTRAEHLSISLGVSVGCRFLGASVTGMYDKSVSQNNDALKSSCKSSVRIGTVSFKSEPSLSPTVLESLDDIEQMRASRVHRFLRDHGDYYVAGLRLGADNNIFVSTDSEHKTKSERKAIRVEAKVLFWKTSKTYASYDASAFASTSVRCAAYDSLADRHDLVEKSGSFETVRQIVQRYQDDGDALPRRVVQTCERLQIAEGKELTLVDVQRLCEAGLVVEVILQPFSSHRQFAALLRQKRPPAGGRGR